MDDKITLNEITYKVCLSGAAVFIGKALFCAG